MTIYKAALIQGIGRIFSLPRLSIPLILTLGLTLGAVLSVIAIASALLLQPLRGVKDESLIRTLNYDFKMSDQITVSYWNMRQLANFNESFKHLGTWAGLSTSNQDITVDETKIHVTQHLASNNILDVLGTTLIQGQDTQIENVEDFIWISKTLWQNVFASATDVIGKQITINDKSYAIAGVLEDLLAAQSREPVLPEQVWVITDLNALIGQPETGSIGGQLQRILLKANNTTPVMPDLDSITRWMEDYVSTYTDEQIATGFLNAIHPQRSEDL